MDSRLKQRLIGAAVLWLLAFIFLPPLLHSSSGRKTVQTSLSVPASNQARQTRSIVLDHSGSAQAAGQGQSHTATPGADTGASPVPDSPPKASRETATAGQAQPPTAGESDASGRQKSGPAAGGGSANASGSTATARGKWAVQVGSFSKKGNALELRKRLRERQYPVMVIPFRLEGETLYRVRVGPRASKEAAGKLKAELAKRMDLEGRVVSQNP